MKQESHKEREEISSRKDGKRQERWKRKESYEGRERDERILIAAMDKDNYVLYMYIFGEREKETDGERESETKSERERKERARERERKRERERERQGERERETEKERKRRTDWDILNNKNLPFIQTIFSYILFLIYLGCQFSRNSWRNVFIS